MPSPGFAAPSIGRLVARTFAVAAMGYGTVVLALGRVTPGLAAAPDRWRLWVGAAALLAATGMLGAGLRWGQRVTPWPFGLLAVMAAAVTVACVAAPVAEISFLPYVAIVAVARALDPGAGWPLLAPVFAAQAFMLWELSRAWQPMAGSLLASVMIVVFTQLRRQRQEAAELEAAQAAALAEQRARTEAAEAQRELAAQIHDVLAHSLSGLAVSLQVAALQAKQEGASADLQGRLAAANELAREGLAGARDAVEVLRRGPSRPASGLTGAIEGDAVGGGAASSGPDEAGPAQPASHDPDARLEALVDRLRAATGTSVEISGSLAGLGPVRGPLAESVVREALTNSVRHAPGLPVEVKASGRGVRVVTRGDIAALPASDHVSGHHGLEGLRRRVEASGGVFTGGPSAAGWLVAAEWAA